MRSARSRDGGAPGVETLLSGEADSNDSYLEVHAGAGGTESQDWAEMLVRMYIRWAERRGYKVEILETTDGEEAGIKSATLQIKGDDAYGWLKTESGVHRLVRISPFDSDARRHTSFASVWVYPVVDDTIDIEINETDCRIDTYRPPAPAASTSTPPTRPSASPTFRPASSSAASRNARSTRTARPPGRCCARLYEAELKQREEKASAERAPKTDIGWGHQIRSYVLQPYQMVKDLRTGVQSTDPRTCSTATSTPSWRRRWRSASSAARPKSRISTSGAVCGNFVVDDYERLHEQELYPRPRGRCHRRAAARYGHTTAAPTRSCAPAFSFSRRASRRARPSWRSCGA